MTSEGFVVTVLVDGDKQTAPPAVLNSTDVRCSKRYCTGRTSRWKREQNCWTINILPTEQGLFED